MYKLTTAAEAKQNSTNESIVDKYIARFDQKIINSAREGYCFVICEIDIRVSIDVIEKIVAKLKEAGYNVQERAEGLQVSWQ